MFLAMPVQVSDRTVVRVQDVAEVRQTYQDAVQFFRAYRWPADHRHRHPQRRPGRMSSRRWHWSRRWWTRPSAGWSDHHPRRLHAEPGRGHPEPCSATSKNNVIAAIILVMLTTILSLGSPGLAARSPLPSRARSWPVILLIYLLGFTLNIVVLFGLIAGDRMLVDGAIVVVKPRSGPVGGHVAGARRS